MSEHLELNLAEAKQIPNTDLRIAAMSPLGRMAYRASSAMEEVSDYVPAVLGTALAAAALSPLGGANASPSEQASTARKDMKPKAMLTAIMRKGDYTRSSDMHAVSANVNGNILRITGDCNDNPEPLFKNSIVTRTIIREKLCSETFGKTEMEEKINPPSPTGFLGAFIISLGNKVASAAPRQNGNEVVHGDAVEIDANKKEYSVEYDKPDQWESASKAAKVIEYIKGKGLKVTAWYKNKKSITPTNPEVTPVPTPTETQTPVYFIPNQPIL